MKKRLENGVFYTVVNGSCTDEGIVDEPLVNDAEITDKLKKSGVVSTLTARMMTPDEENSQEED